MSREKKRARDKRHAPAGSLRGWERYWYEPIDAIRPYLLFKGVLLLIAFDVWLLRVKSGWDRGIDGFNVAHFQWLDMLQPVPTPELYVAVHLAVGILALLCVFTEAGILVRVVLALLYSYGWAMSMIDNYQHHYFLSLVLAAFIFFPVMRAGDLYAGARGSEGAQEAPVRALPVVNAWAYVLLGVNVAIVYLFTAVNKIEPGWRAGAIVERLARKKQWLAAPEGWVAGMGVSKEFFWESMALSVVAVEIYIAACYLLAPARDYEENRWRRVLCWSALVAVVVFNGIGNEMVLSLRIGWFSYYMIGLALVYFLPATLLWKAGEILTWPGRKLSGLQLPLVEGANRGSRLFVGLLGAAAIAVIAIIAAAGIAIDLPGAAHAGGATAAVLLGISLFYLTRENYPGVVRFVTATAAAWLVMWVTLTQSTVRSEFYDVYAWHLRKRHEVSAADAADTKARLYLPPGREDILAWEGGAGRETNDPPGGDNR